MSGEGVNKEEIETDRLWIVPVIVFAILFAAWCGYMSSRAQHDARIYDLCASLTDQNEQTDTATKNHESGPPHEKDERLADRANSKNDIDNFKAKCSKAQQHTEPIEWVWRLFATPDHWSAWGTVVVAFLTGLAVILLRGTLKATQAAEKATKDTIEVTREVGEAQTRAYVGVSRCGITIDNDYNCKYSFKIKNSGNSPARYCRLEDVVVGVKAWKSGVEDQIIDSTSVLFPDISSGEEVPHVSQIRSVDVAKIQEWVENKQAICFFFDANFVYEDVFEKQERFPMRFTTYFTGPYVGTRTAHNIRKDA